MKKILFLLPIALSACGAYVTNPVPLMVDRTNSWILSHPYFFASNNIGGITLPQLQSATNNSNLDANGMATKGYALSLFSSIEASNIITGTVPNARLPVYPIFASYVASSVSVSTGPGVETQTAAITATGAAAGDPVTVGVPSSAAFNGCVYYAYVSASDQVKLVFQNNNPYGVSISGTFNLIVWKH